MHKLPLHFSIFIIFTSLIFLTSCEMNNTGSHNVKIGINNWSGYDPFIIADKKNLFSENKLNAKVYSYLSSTEAITAFKNNEIQGITLTFDELVSLISSGYNLKVVLILDFSNGGDMIIGQNEITSIEQLSGKRIGVEGTVVGEYLLKKALQNNGIRISTVDLINIKPDNWNEFFSNNKIDALVCYNPFASHLTENKDLNVLFTSKNIPYQIIDVLAFSESYYNNNKNLIAQIVKTWFDALEFQNENKDESFNITKQVKDIDSLDYFNSLDGLLIPDFETNKKLFNPESENNIYKYSQPIINFMISEMMISERINTTDLFPSEIYDQSDR